MIAGMDLNVSPEPEEHEVFPEPQSEEDKAPEELYEHVEHGETALQILRREHEERIKRTQMQCPHDKQPYGYQSTLRDDWYQVKRKRLPSGWLDCPAFGKEIGCMIPSKVPLCESFNDCIPPGRRYSFKQVLHQQRVLGRKLGLVIDLTNSTGYYNFNEWRKEGIKHVKIACKGRDSVPDNEAVNKFFYEAIKIFSDARPPGIDKADYIDALYNFYHEVKPEWLFALQIQSGKDLQQCLMRRMMTALILLAL